MPSSTAHSAHLPPAQPGRQWNAKNVCQPSLGHDNLTLYCCIQHVAAGIVLNETGVNIVTFTYYKILHFSQDFIGLYQQQAQQHVPQAIVRPWDTVAVAAAAAAAKNAAVAAAAAASPAPSVSPGQTSTAAEAAAAQAAAVERRKSSSGGNGSGGVNDSPLDALFQMASKTFEGLKAKSGRIKKNT